MNYTGTTTFTSLTGVRKEITVSVPLIIIAAVTGLGLQIADFMIKGDDIIKIKNNGGKVLYIMEKIQSR